MAALHCFYGTMLCSAVIFGALCVKTSKLKIYIVAKCKLMVGMHNISCPGADKELKDLMFFALIGKSTKCTPISGTTSQFQLTHHDSPRQLPSQPSSTVANRWGIHLKLREKTRVTANNAV